MSVIFYSAAVLLVFPHLIYPAVIYLLAHTRKPRVHGSACPSVTLVISAFNEAAVIREKLLNALSLDYPPEQLDVMVISDASSDATDDIVREFTGPRVSLCRQEERLGKSAGLTRFCPQATGEILVFTDANSIFETDALRNLVRHFDDPDVGYAVGCQLYSTDNVGASADSENVYWSIELKLKEWESRVSSVVGADGAIYALRKELFEPLAPEDINDFVLPLKVVGKGYRGVFDRQAVCYEEAAPSFRGEFRRKYRIVNRSLRAVTKVPAVFNPFRVGWFAFQLIAHKVLRWLGPVFLATMLITSGLLALLPHSDPGIKTVFGGYFAVQLIAYFIALLYIFPPLRRFRPIYIAYYFLLINCAAAVGIGLLATGRTIGVWKPQR